MKAVLRGSGAACGGVGVGAGSAADVVGHFVGEDEG